MKDCCWYAKQTDGKWHSLFCLNGPNVCGNGRPLPHTNHSFNACVTENVITRKAR